MRLALPGPVGPSQRRHAKARNPCDGLGRGGLVFSVSGILGLKRLWGIKPSVVGFRVQGLGFGVVVSLVACLKPL